mgnify:CR=1 FL=1
MHNTRFLRAAPAVFGERKRKRERHLRKWQGKLFMGPSFLPKRIFRDFRWLSGG